MAITIVDSPQKFTPVFNPVVFSVTSDNYAQPDFKYVADVYTGDGAQLATLKFQPQVEGTEPVYFELQKVLYELVGSNYCKPNAAVSPSIVVTGAGVVADYSVQFGEQYGGVLHANLTSRSGYVFNGALPWQRFPFYDQSAYLNRQFLTLFNRQVVRPTDSAILSILQSDTEALANFTLRVYDVTGTQTYTTTIVNPYTSLSDASNRALHLHVGFSYLFARLGFPGAVYNTAACYTITPAGGTAFRYDLYSQCSKFPGYRLHFLNELGGFDAFNFMMASSPSVTTKKDAYMTQPSNRRTMYDPANRRFEAVKRNYNTTYTEKVHVVSDYMTDDEARQLAGLISSPLVYLETDAGEYGGTAGMQVMIPVDITTTDYTVKKARTDKLFNVEMDLQFMDNYRQVV